MTIRLFEYDAQMVLVGLESPTWNFGTKIPCFILILISPMPRKERVHLRLTVCHQGNGRIWRLPGMWSGDDGAERRGRAEGVFHTVSNTVKP